MPEDIEQVHKIDIYTKENDHHLGYYGFINLELAQKLLIAVQKLSSDESKCLRKILQIYTQLNRTNESIGSQDWRRNNNLINLILTKPESIKDDISIAGNHFDRNSINALSCNAKTISEVLQSELLGMEEIDQVFNPEWQKNQLNRIKEATQKGKEVIRFDFEECVVEETCFVQNLDQPEIIITYHDHLKKLNDLLPLGIKFSHVNDIKYFLECDEDDGFQYKEKEQKVCFNTICSKERLFFLFHEIGHSWDEIENGGKYKKMQKEADYLVGDTFQQERHKMISMQERNANAWAMKTLHKLCKAGFTLFSDSFLKETVRKHIHERKAYKHNC
ncbi:MAG: hypothetical protein ACD_58C00112G0009 [uncultured bacterium]|nr:MAG: hypothetical protein ACD_58C00112G0009 [uncultured bacterium]